MARNPDCRPDYMLLSLTGYIDPEEKTHSDYAYIPFDMPAGIVRIDIRYSVSHPRDAADLRGEGNTIDIGVFDPRGHDF